MSADGRQQFIYTLEAVEPEKAGNPDTWTDYDHETYRLHLVHLEKEAESRRIILVGRAQDGIGPAIAIIECGDEGEARLMESDPFVSRGPRRRACTLPRGVRGRSLTRK
jgi:uncharacterized protein YciI